MDFFEPFKSFGEGRSLTFPLSLSPFVVEPSQRILSEPIDQHVESFFMDSTLRLRRNSFVNPPPGFSSKIDCKDNYNNKTNDKEKNLFKTEMCQSAERNERCRYGNRCNFAHSPEELRFTKKHPRYKTELCKSFTLNGYCSYGKRCCFIHKGIN
jgi:hypothetical protein